MYFCYFVNLIHRSGNSSVHNLWFIVQLNRIYHLSFQCSVPQQRPQICCSWSWQNTCTCSVFYSILWITIVFSSLIGIKVWYLDNILLSWHFKHVAHKYSWHNKQISIAFSSSSRVNSVCRLDDQSFCCQMSVIGKCFNHFSGFPGTPLLGMYKHPGRRWNRKWSSILVHLLFI